MITRKFYMNNLTAVYREPLIPDDFACYELFCDIQNLDAAAIKISAKRADGSVIRDIAQIPEGQNIASYVLSSNMYNIEGDLEIRFALCDENGSVLTVTTAYFTVAEAFSDIQEADDNVGLLNSILQAVSKMGEIEQRVKDAHKVIDLGNSSVFDTDVFNSLYEPGIYIVKSCEKVPLSGDEYDDNFTSWFLYVETDTYASHSNPNSVTQTLEHVGCHKSYMRFAENDYTDGWNNLYWTDWEINSVTTEAELEALATQVDALKARIAALEAKV